MDGSLALRSRRPTLRLVATRRGTSSEPEASLDEIASLVDRAGWDLDADGDDPAAVIAFYDPSQHPISRIPDLVLPIARGEHDFVVGAAHGSRPCASWKSRLLARLARPLSALSHPYSGFFAFDSRRLRSPRSVRTMRIGHALEAWTLGTFDRPCTVDFDSEGERGLGGQVTTDSPLTLRRVLAMYRNAYPSRMEFVQFAFVGGTGFVVDVSVYAAIQWFLGIGHLQARVASFWVSASWNWFWNRQLTFAGREHARKRVQWSKFLLTSLLGFGVNWGTYYALTTWISFFDGTFTRVIAMFLGVLAGMSLNFVLARRFVFSQKRSLAARGAARMPQS
ncbi:MAG: GtrA family protein [Planctomycetes bacterium]|nr:GtrA family protein [Planctomycetota bacterium]MCB9917670.1 GtrA family protein [Planctomycetota bacterium]